MNYSSLTPRGFIKWFEKLPGHENSSLWCKTPPVHQNIAFVPAPVWPASLLCTVSCNTLPHIWRDQTMRSSIVQLELKLKRSKLCYLFMVPLPFTLSLIWPFVCRIYQCVYFLFLQPRPPSYLLYPPQSIPFIFLPSSVSFSSSSSVCFISLYISFISLLLFLLSLSLSLPCKMHPGFPRGLILLEMFQEKRIICRSGMIFGESSLTLD